MTKIKLEDFQRGNISIECDNKQQANFVAKWAGKINPLWTIRHKYVDYSFGSVYSWPKPNLRNYKFSEVELLKQN